MRTPDPRTIAELIARVDARLAGEAPAPTSSPPGPRSGAGSARGGVGCLPSVDVAVGVASGAAVGFASAGLEVRRRVIAAVRAAMLEVAEPLAVEAHAETGIGRAADKVVKNRLVTLKAPGPEDLEPVVVTGDGGMTVTEFAPFGVVGAITPTTNPTSTVINNAISIVSAGNAVVFNVHPGAARVSARTIELLDAAIVGAGGPSGLVVGVADPSIETAKQLMNHPDVRLLLVTGGPGVVREALASAKRAVTAGPGNPPVVVDHTADVQRAARDIVRGASFDNNLICTDEKTTIAVRGVTDELVAAMGRQGGYVLAAHELARLERVIFAEPGRPGRPGRINGRWVGKDAAAILAEIGVRVGGEVRLVVARVANDHPLVWTEQMLPVMPVTEAVDVEAAIVLARDSEHRFRHTAGVHSTNVEVITRMARVMQSSIFVANAPHFAGLGHEGEGFCSFSIATPTGDGLTRPRTFSRERRLTVAGSLRVV